MRHEEKKCDNCNADLGVCQCADTVHLSTELGPVCPYCGHVEKACNSDGSLYQEDTDYWFCHECDNEFRVRIHIKHSWTTRRH